MNTHPRFILLRLPAKRLESSRTLNFRSCHFLVRISILFYLFCIAAGCSNHLPEDVRILFGDLPSTVDFNFDIRPILADRCYPCHGPDNSTREAELRLDLEAPAFARLQHSNGYALVKGDLSQSIAWKRIISHDPELMMPPPESNLSLSAKEKALIARWIQQGASWKDHWAFIPPQETELPQDLPSEWERKNEIDHFVQAKLALNRLSPSSEAEKERLIRRLSFDLTGLPPTLEEIDIFISDDSPAAYETLVDRLLSSDAHAERLAMEWLDVARYADSHGMHADGLRIMWRWRDWVIDAFKKNQPYDEFVTWQIAGDLMPEARREQKLATGFYRNQPLNAELGIVSEEYRLKYVADRTNTTATAFLGLTMECASCHDHKFDPVSQKEYYEMSAFFNNVKELGMIGNDLNFGPLLLLPDTLTEKKINELSNSIDKLETQIKITGQNVVLPADYNEEIKLTDIKYPTPLGSFAFETVIEKKNRNGRVILQVDGKENVTAVGTPEIVEGKIGNGIRIDSDYDQIHLKDINHFDLFDAFSAGTWLKTERKGTFQSIMGNIGDKNSGWRGWLFFIDTLNRPGLLLVHNLSHNSLHVVADEAIGINEWSHVFFTYDGSTNAQGISLYIDGEPVNVNVLNNQLYKNILPVRSRNYQPDPTRSIRMGLGSKYLFSETDDGVFYGTFDEVKIFNQYLTHMEVAVIPGQKINTDETEKNQSVDFLDYYLHRRNQPFQELNRQLKQLRREKFALLDGVEEVMVMEEMPHPRPTYILNRGQYDDLGEEVIMNTPAAILPFSGNYERNRLGLAGWLFSDANPLKARVAVNRYWQMIFGKGIVSTPHDFGIQGALPTHPELLDWLAIEFKNSGWDLRRLLKLMVMSATYRQSSVIREESKGSDPKNIWLSYGPSQRLQIEMIRDNALAASGLLCRQIGGESVKPYQPYGLWKEKNEFSGFLIEYENGTGDDLYRRSMYTFIRRTSPPPIMTTFDSPARDVCTVKRESTNTPLQALVLLNDPQFVESARILAERIQKEGGKETEVRIQHAFRLVCGRFPDDLELKLLLEQHNHSVLKYGKDKDALKDLLQVGEMPADEKLNVVETAALTMVCNTIMNFDEAYMKR